MERVGIKSDTVCACCAYTRSLSFFVIDPFLKSLLSNLVVIENEAEELVSAQGTLNRSFTLI